MAPNDFVIDQVLAQVLMFPETHNQDFWDTSDSESCGTTRCIAGWAVHFSDQFEVEMADCGCGCGLSEVVGPIRKETGESVNWATAGAEALGIPLHRASSIFHDYDNEAAISKLKDLKNG